MFLQQAVSLPINEKVKRGLLGAFEGHISGTCTEGGVAGGPLVELNPKKRDSSDVVFFSLAGWVFWQVAADNLGEARFGLLPGVFGAMGSGRTRKAVGIQPGTIDQDGFRDVRKGFMDGDEVLLTSFSRKFTNRAELLRVGEREVGKASTVSHTAVSRVRALVLSDGEVYLVHDRVGRGWATLLDEVKWNGRIDESRSRYLIVQLLTGLEHYHSKGIAHWDIQPRNISIGNNDELCVLNICTGAIKLKASTGVLQYVPSQLSCRAPELFNGVTLLTIKEGIHADVWSCGVVLYFMLCGKLPFEDDRLCELKHKIYAAEGMYFPPWVSESARGFVRKLLRTDPKSRPSTQKALREPWIRENGEKSVKATIRSHLSVLQETKLSIKALSSKQKCKEVKRKVHVAER